MDKVSEATKLLIEHDSEQNSKKAPLILIDDWVTGSHLKFCGIELGSAITKMSYEALPGGEGNHLNVDIDISELLKIISRLSQEDIEKAKEIIGPYLAR